MENANTVGIKEYEFSKNVDFIDTSLIEVKRELMKKKIQLNSIYNNKMLSTENTYSIDNVGYFTPKKINFPLNLFLNSLNHLLHFLIHLVII